MATTVKIGDSLKFHLNEQEIHGFKTFGEPGTDGPHEAEVVAVVGDGGHVDVEAIDSRGNKHRINNLPVSPAKSGQSFVTGCEAVTEVEKPLGTATSEESSTTLDGSAAVDDIVSNDPSDGTLETSD
jgi:hypothetical protein